MKFHKTHKYDNAAMMLIIQENCGRPEGDLKFQTHAGDGGQ